MITLVRQATVCSGKLGEGLAFAREIASLASRIASTDVKVVAAAAGPVPTIGWITVFKDFADFEARSASLMGNAEYVAALKKASGLLIDGSITDQLWRHL
jgi:hypothetical protein